MSELTPEEVLENFEFLEDWDARYAYLVELGEKLPPLDDAYRVEENRVKGCMSKVWVSPVASSTSPGRIDYVGDCDTAVIKGVLALLIGLMSDRTPGEIEALDLDGLFEQLNLAEHLSPNRHFGIFALVELMKTQARDLAAGDAAGGG